MCPKDAEGVADSVDLSDCSLGPESDLFATAYKALFEWCHEKTCFAIWEQQRRR